MRGLQRGFPESIDDIVSAVEETPRGRWFLRAYAERLRKGETDTILASIEKLETSLKSMTGSSADSKLIESTRAAIAQARQEISQLGPEISGLSHEGQLFAKLAEQSRQAFGNAQTSPAISQGVERAMRLVADIERNFTDPSPASVAPPANPASYFKQDEAIFEPAPTKPQLVLADNKSTGDTPARGARLVIERVGQTIREPVAAETHSEAKPADVFASQPTAEAEEKPRITIIRHAVEELPEVPLLDITTGRETSPAA